MGSERVGWEAGHEQVSSQPATLLEQLMSALRWDPDLCMPGEGIYYYLVILICIQRPAGVRAITVPEQTHHH
jgi:hypothetical protein